MEMEVEANVRVGEWLTLQDADRTLTPLHGPGVTATEAFRGRYALALPSYVEVAMYAVAGNGSATAVAESFGLQMSKLGQVLRFGVYSIPPIGIGEMKGGEVVRKQPGEALSVLTLTPFTYQTLTPSLPFDPCLIHKERVETILCLPIPVEAATNKDEVSHNPARPQCPTSLHHSRPATGVPPAPPPSLSSTSEDADPTSLAVPPLPDEEVGALSSGMQRLSTPT
uniref:Uncharacterized protein n=1 Tax=Echinococcus canadensis TaxID=519352 RepID=A0A915EX43_9CEST